MWPLTATADVNRGAPAVENLRYLLQVCKASLAILLTRTFWGKDRGVWRRYLMDKFGCWPRRWRDARPSVLLMVNAGEILGLTVFCATLRRLFPQHDLVIAVDNPEAVRFGEPLGLADVFIYTPWDFGWLATRLARRFDIRIVVFVAKIFHPVASRAWRANGIVAGMVSGHFTHEMYTLERNIPTWRRLLALRAYEELDFVAMQAEEQKEEFLTHIARRDVYVLGNIRADVSHAAATPPEQEEFYRRLHLTAGDPIVVAAATRGDEELILDAFRRVVAEVPGVRLVLVPRYIEQAPRIRQLAAGMALDAVVMSGARAPAQVVVIDESIMLGKLYSIARVIVFARTFQRVGGWTNILEPSYHAKPIVFGTELKLWPEGLTELCRTYPDVCVPPTADAVAAAVAHFLCNDVAARQVGGAFQRLTVRGEEIAVANARFVHERSRRSVHLLTV